MKRSMRQELDIALCEIRLSAERRAQILAAADEVQTGRKRVRPARVALLAAAVCIVLGLTALAVSPTLREALSDALGSFAPFAGEVTGVCADDQGIQIRAVSAVADRSIVRVYLEVQDHEMDRFSAEGGISLDLFARRSGGASTGWSTQCRQILYDPETRTALFELRLCGKDILEATPENRLLNIFVQGIQPGIHQISSVQLPQSLLSDQTRETMVLETGEKVLTPGQTPEALDGAGGASVSSAGFDGDGRLHVQLLLPEGMYTNAQYDMITTVYSKTLDPEANQRLVERYNEEIEHVLFTIEGKSYFDLKFSAAADDYEDLALGLLGGSFVGTDRIVGAWELSVPLEDLPERTVSMRETIGGLTVEQLYLTTLGATVRCDGRGQSEKGYTINGFPLTVFFSDGTSRVVTRGSSPAREGDQWYYQWVFDDAVEPDQVTGIAIGKWRIPLSGDTAGPGCWMESSI